MARGGYNDSWRGGVKMAYKYNGNGGNGVAAVCSGMALTCVRGSENNIVAACNVMSVSVNLAMAWLSNK